jgi:hypothetical protein
MKSIEAEHRARPWRVHRIATDFELTDVWRFDLGRKDERGLDQLLEVVWNVAKGIEQSALGRMRVWLGQKLGWDIVPEPLPIPGCRESSVAARLTDAEIAENRVRQGEPSPLPSAGATPIYRFADEALYEVSNKTIHALLHVGWAPEVNGASGVLAIYVKHRGVASRAYMAAIWPARHAIIYPALIARVERGWRRDAA